jgi:transposase
LTLEFGKKGRAKIVTAEEETEIRRLAASRKEPHNLMQRAKLIVAMLDTPNLYASHAAIQVGFPGEQTGINWVRRFNAEGVAGLQDKPKAGRSPTHDQTVRSTLIALARTKPKSLGYPFKLWTLERLQTAFQERNGIHLSDSTIWEWVEGEGFRWKRQESWFHDTEKADPAFVEKRGASSRSTKPRSQASGEEKLYCQKQ